MGNYTIWGLGGGGGFENATRGRQARNLTTNVPKIVDLKSSSEQIFSKNCRWVPLNFQNICTIECHNSTLRIRLRAVSYFSLQSYCTRNQS